MSGLVLISLKIYQQFSSDLWCWQLKLLALWYMRLHHKPIIDMGFGLLFSYLESCQVGVKENLANACHKKFPSLFFKCWLKSYFSMAFFFFFLQLFNTTRKICLPLVTQWFHEVQSVNNPLCAHRCRWKPTTEKVSESVGEMKGPIQRDGQGRVQEKVGGRYCN